MAWLKIRQYLCLLVFSADAQRVTFEKSRTLPVKGSSLALSCIPSVTFTNSAIVYKIKDRSVFCAAYNYKCGFYNFGYSFTSNTSGAFALISSLNRTSDEWIWECEYDNQPSTRSLLNIIVYTIPKGLTFSQDPSTSVDLSVTNVKLQCKSSSCMYPMASVQWFYQDQSEPATHVLFAATNSSGSPEACLDQEQIYTSTLDIPMYTTLSDNSDKTVTFSCRIVYLDSSINIMATGQNTVRFSVAVTSVTLNISTSEVVFYEGYPQMLTCISSPSRPISTIRWSLGSRPLTDNITTTNTTGATGLYIRTSHIFLTVMKNASNQHIQCEGFIDGQQAVVSMEKPSVNVWYKPSKPLVREYGGANSDFPWLENMTGILQCNSSDYGNPSANVTWFSDRGMMNTMNNLVIRGLMPNDDKRNISCKLVNRFTSAKNIHVLSDPVMLNVEYHPIIKYNASSNLLLNETQSLSVLCEATGNPNPQSVQWKNRLDGSMLRFYNVSRMDKGTYTCEATASSMKFGKLTSQKQIDIIVKYAPDVKVTLTGSNQQNQTAMLVCEAQGVPDLYTFNAWVHMWKDMVVRTGLQGVTNASHSILTIDRLSLESMGTYICTTTNGIVGLNGHLNQNGSENLIVSGRPNILNTSTLFFGEIGMSVNISIPLYSNPVIESFVIHRNETEIINNSRTTTLLSWDLVNYTFYGSTVKLKAQKAHLIFQNLTHQDFDNYKLELRNSIGKTDFRFQLDSFVPSTLDGLRSGLPVASLAGGISAGIVCIVLIAIGIFLWRRNQNKTQSEHGNDVLRKQEKRRNQINTSSAKQDGDNRKEYEGLHFTETETNQYIPLTDITLEENRNVHISLKSTETESYERLHPDANDDIQMYSSLKIPKISKDSKIIYENTCIPRPDKAYGYQHQH